MNPFDAIGTARISQRGVRPRLPSRGRLPGRAGRGQIIAARVAGDAPLDPEWLANVVEVVRRTRAHPDVRIGSSVRGAIDTCAVAPSLPALRGCRRPTGVSVSTPRSSRSPVGCGSARARSASDGGHRHRAVARGVRRARRRAVTAREKRPPRAGRSGGLTPPSAREGGRRGRRRGRRRPEADDLARDPRPQPRFEQVSPEVGELDEAARRASAARRSRRRRWRCWPTWPAPPTRSCASSPAGWPAAVPRHRPARPGAPRGVGTAARAAVPTRRRRPRRRRQHRGHRRGPRQRSAIDAERPARAQLGAAGHGAVPAGRPQRVDGRQAAGDRGAGRGGGGQPRRRRTTACSPFGKDVVVAKCQDVRRSRATGSIDRCSPLRGLRHHRPRRRAHVRPRPAGRSRAGRKVTVLLSRLPLHRRRRSVAAACGSTSSSSSRRRRLRRGPAVRGRGRCPLDDRDRPVRRRRRPGQSPRPRPDRRRGQTRIVTGQQEMESVRDDVALDVLRRLRTRQRRRAGRPVVSGRGGGSTARRRRRSAVGRAGRVVVSNTWSGAPASGARPRKMSRMACMFVALDLRVRARRCR